MYVQFSDDNKEIISVFDCPQDPETRANLGEVEEDDPRYIKFMDVVKTVNW